MGGLHSMRRDSTPLVRCTSEQLAREAEAARA